MKNLKTSSTSALLLLAMASSSQVLAQSIFTPTTAGTYNWDNTSNWQSGNAPTSGVDTALVFGNGATLAGGTVTANNNIGGTAAFKLNRLNINYAAPASGTAAMTLTGNQLEFINSSGAVAPTLVFNTTGTVKPSVTISSNILFTNTSAITTTSNATFSGVVSGAGGFTKAGAGTLIVQNNATATGGTALGNIGVSAGILQIGNNGGFGSLGSGTITLSGSGSLNVARANGSFNFDNTITGSTSGSVNFNLNNSATPTAFAVTLTKANTYTAATNLQAFANSSVGAPTLKNGIDNALSTTTALTINTVTGSTAVMTYDLSGFNQTIGSLASGAGVSTTNGIVTNSGTAKTLTISNESGTKIYAGLISGDIELVKAGASTQTLTGLNSYSGLTKVDGGSLETGVTGSFGSNDIRVGTASLNLGNNTSIADTASLFLSSGSTLNLGFTSGFETISGLTIAGNAVAVGTYTAAQLANLGFGGTFNGAGKLNISSAIPEPSTYAALAGLAILGFALRRRAKA